MSQDERALRGAAFLVQALELELEPASLARDLVVLRNEPQSVTYATELSTEAGNAAFLIYVYDLRRRAQGKSGKHRFESDIATLQTAAERNTPGPRLLAHAESATEGYLLATTPATYRVLSGEASLEELEATEGHLLPGGGTDDLRRTGASELLRLLRTSNLQAGSWLAALQAEGRLGPADAESTDELDTISFNEEETELALFLLDDRSIQNLLRALNLLISAARASAESPNPERP